MVRRKAPAEYESEGVSSNGLSDPERRRQLEFLRGSSVQIASESGEHCDVFPNIPVLVQRRSAARIVEGHGAVTIDIDIHAHTTNAAVPKPLGKQAK